LAVGERLVQTIKEVVALTEYRDLADAHRRQALALARSLDCL
jgi:hypothetical protein